MNLLQRAEDAGSNATAGLMPYLRAKGLHD